MRETLQATSGCERAGSGGEAGIHPADLLHLAAAPTFALIAVLTGIFGRGAHDGLCSAAGAWPLSGMVPMYLLMCIFHMMPWLRLIFRQNDGGPHTCRRSRLDAAG